MEYVQFTPEIYNQLREQGYKYLIHDHGQLDPKEVGHDDTGAYAYVEITPLKEQPATWDMDKGAYYDIGSPEALSFIDEGEIEGSYDTYFWIKKTYL